MDEIAAATDNLKDVLQHTATLIVDAAFTTPLHENETTTASPYSFDTNGLVDGFKPLHWVKVYEALPPPVSVHTLLGVYCVLVGILGVVGNLTVIWLFTTTKSLRTPSNLLIVNLALSDFLMIGSNAPLYSYSSFHGRWMFGKIGCHVYGWFGSMFGLMSINNLALISVDRYYVIVNTEKLKKLSYKQAIAGLAIVWAWCFAWCLPPWIGPMSYAAEGFLTTCSFDYVTQTISARYFVLGMFLGCFVLPLVIILACYYVIFKKIGEHKRAMKQTIKGLNASINKQGERNQEMQVAKVALKLVFMYLWAWTPYAVVSMMGYCGRLDLLTPLASQLCALFAKSATIYNPIVYAASHPKFRAALIKRVPLVSSMLTSDSDTSGTAGSVTRTSHVANNSAKKARLQTEPSMVSTEYDPNGSVRNPFGRDDSISIDIAMKMISKFAASLLEDERGYRQSTKTRNESTESEEVKPTHEHLKRKNDVSVVSEEDMAKILNDATDRRKVFKECAKKAYRNSKANSVTSPSSPCYENPSYVSDDAPSVVDNEKPPAYNSAAMATSSVGNGKTSAPVKTDMVQVKL